LVHDKLFLLDATMKGKTCDDGLVFLLHGGVPPEAEIQTKNKGISLQGSGFTLQVLAALSASLRALRFNP